MDISAIDKTSEIFTKIKKHMGITWDYQDDDVLDIVKDGIQLIQSKAGQVDDFLVNRVAFLLLKSYCRYAWDGTESLWEDNYRSEILQLQINVAIDTFGGA